MMESSEGVHWFHYPTDRLGKSARRYSENRKVSPLWRLQEELRGDLTILRNVAILIFTMQLVLLLSALYLVLCHLL